MALHSFDPKLLACIVMMLSVLVMHDNASPKEGAHHEGRVLNDCGWSSGLASCVEGGLP